MSHSSLKHGTVTHEKAVGLHEHDLRWVSRSGGRWGGGGRALGLLRAERCALRSFRVVPRASS